MKTLQTTLNIALAAGLLAAGVLAGCKSDSNPTTTVDPSADVTLAAPPAGQGIQVVIGPFTVPAGTEVQKNFYQKLPTTEDIYVNKIEFKFNPGSHHFNVFKSDTVNLKDTIVDSFSALEWEKWDMVCASQRSDYVWQLPPGVAIKLSAAAQMDFQTHYVNAGTQSTPSGRGKAIINFWTIDKSQVTNTVGAVFSNNKTIDIPPHTSATYCKVVKTIDHDVSLLLMTGHFHSRGKTFTVGHWDGTKLKDTIYHSNAWSDPPILQFPTPLLLRANDSIAYITTYENNTDAEIKFGPHVEVEEHANLFTFYYPGPVGSKAIYDFTGGFLMESHPI
ncbi:MAG TPA: hypothetical protein VHI13_12890 [Candidatus Kapabacteria bacterium]|nr:hypothetical protein [Candidatus Kapabacteria bacterium]